MRPLLPLALPVLALAACAAPPLGLGTGAHLPTTATGAPAPQGFVAAGAAAVAVADHRQAFQAEASVTGIVAPRWFSIDAGAVYSQVSDDREGQIFAAGAILYVRPRLQLRNVSIATAVAGLGFGGGGGGIVGGIVDLQVGYGTPRWSAYAGRYEMVYDVVGGEEQRTWALQYRLGGEYLFPMGAVKLGVAVEVYRQRDSFRAGGEIVGARFVGAGLKLRIESGVFQ